MYSENSLLSILWTIAAKSKTASTSSAKYDQVLKLLVKYIQQSHTIWAKHFTHVICMPHNLMDALKWCNEATEMFVCKLKILQTHWKLTKFNHSVLLKLCQCCIKHFFLLCIATSHMHHNSTATIHELIVNNYLNSHGQFPVFFSAWTFSYFKSEVVSASALSYLITLH